MTRWITGSQRSGNGLAWAVAIGIIVLVTAGIAIPLVSVGTSIHVPSPSVFTEPAANNPAPTTPQPNTSTPSRHISYLAVPGLRTGLAHISKLAPGARYALVRIAATSLIATARLPNGNSKEIILSPTGTFVESGTATGGRAIPLSQIRPPAIARIIAGMRARFHVPVSRIDYIVLSTPPGLPAQWIVFSKAPGHPGYTATLSGTRLARLPGS
ncbi:MAG: hypothetical protein ACJ764_11260 [Solirubrobacteraceae bacterium]